MVRRVVHNIHPVIRLIKMRAVGRVKTGEKFKITASHADVRIVVLILASVKQVRHYPFHRQAIFNFTVFYDESKSAKVHK